MSWLRCLITINCRSTLGQCQLRIYSILSAILLTQKMMVYGRPGGGSCTHCILNCAASDKAAWFCHKTLISCKGLLESRLSSPGQTSWSDGLVSRETRLDARCHSQIKAQPAARTPDQCNSEMIRPNINAYLPGLSTLDGWWRCYCTGLHVC